MRILGLDILRTAAVVFVLFRHSEISSGHYMRHFGWLGVDLFFVLSGFLISRLLFLEYQKNKTVTVSRFLGKRAFKIFPPFYFFMFSTILYHQFIGHVNFKNNEVLAELFYLQSYLPHIWQHTWSLAVEEHFYISFSLFILLFSRKHLIEKKPLMIFLLLFLVLFSFSLRFYESYPHRNDNFFGFMQTHLRSDGIILGVLISYLHHYTKWTQYILRHRMPTFILSLILVAPGFYYAPGSYFMNTLGLTTVNIGFMFWVLLSLELDDYLKVRSIGVLLPVLRFIGFIGLNSYSIYLWHLNSKEIVYSLFSFDTSTMTLMYISLSIVLGVFMSYLIEKPALRLRGILMTKKKHFCNLSIKRTE